MLKTFEMRKPVGLILAGGQSKRLFPIELPKPLLRVDGQFLLSQAIERLTGFDVYIIVNPLIARQIEDTFRSSGLAVPKFIIEKEGRDTAAAVGFGLKNVRHLNPEWVAVLSADTYMKESHLFSEFLKTVEAEVRNHPQALFVCGSPAKTKDKSGHSHFGWIVPLKVRGMKSLPVKIFVEKPSGAKLRKVRRDGGLINAGMFFGKYDTFLSAYQRFYPDVLRDDIDYAKLVRTPIDRAIFENFESVRVMPLALRWEDLGTWKDWFEVIGKGQGSGGVQLKSKNVLISSDESFQVFSFSNEDLAIVQSGNKILVMPLSKSKELKNYLESM
jgi:mannose-1-phosphate guanylyltransferase